MDITDAKSGAGARKRRKRIGRGEGSGYGKTSGRGMNGARSRSGWSQRNMTGGNIPLWRRLPKVGFTNAAFRKEYSSINVGRLDIFESGEQVTPELLRDKGMLNGMRGSGLKILGDGLIDKPLTVCAHKFSKGAREKIEAAGGSCEVIPGPKKLIRKKMKQKGGVKDILVEEVDETDQ